MTVTPTSETETTGFHTLLMMRSVGRDDRFASLDTRKTYLQLCEMYFHHICPERKQARAENHSGLTQNQILEISA